MQTAVQFIEEKLDNLLELYTSEWEKVNEVLEQAKEMEKQQKGFSEEEVYKLLCSMPNFFNMTIPEEIEAREQWYREQLKSRQ